MDHGGKVFEAAERIGCPPEEILDFSSNLNAFYPLERIEALLKERLNWISFYPEVGRCQRALSAFFDLPAENLLVGSGSGQLIPLLLQALGPEEILVPVPTFSEYERSARALNIKTSFVELSPEEDFRLDPERVLKAIGRGTGVVFLCNPNNPTGHFLCPEALFRLAEGLTRRGWWLVLDEAFRDFLPPHKRPAMERLAMEGMVVIIRSLTKALAIPGLRLGYLIAPREVVKRAEALSPPWPINTLAQAVLEHLKELWDAFEETLPEILSAKRSLAEGLRRFFVVYPSEANFLLLRRETALELPQRLLERRILVRDPKGFRGLGKGFLRVAVRRPEENERLLKTLQEVIDEGVERAFGGHRSSGPKGGTAGQGAHR